MHAECAAFMKLLFLMYSLYNDNQNLYFGILILIFTSEPVGKVYERESNHSVVGNKKIIIFVISVAMY